MLDRLPLQKISLYLGLALGLSFMGMQLPSIFLEPDSIAAQLLGILLYSWGPALAVLVVTKYVYQGSLARYGWNRKRFSFTWIGICVGLPILIVIGAIAVVFLLGNVMHLPGFGQVVLGEGLVADKILGHSPWNITAGLAAAFSVEMQMPPEIWTLVILVLVIGVVAGATFNLLFNVGEEVGWRGFMVRETQALGFLGSNVLIGVLYGLWQLPLLLAYVPGFDLDTFFAILTTVGFAISVSFPMAWLALKTRSIYASATFIGVLNNIAAVSIFFTLEGNLFLVSVKGMAGMLVMMVLTFAILRLDRKFVDRYEDLVY